MKDKPTLSHQDRADRALMLRLGEDRGAMTARQLVAAGVSEESQARNAGWVAEQLRLREFAEAA